MEEDYSIANLAQKKLGSRIDANVFFYMPRVKGFFVTGMNYMRQAIELARNGLGTTSPNPLVGAVVVKDGKVVGRGYHQKAGQAHAEVNALADAGKDARDATLYVNLESCCHQGRTGPCTEAIIKAGVAEVHMAILDPNPKVAGKGKVALEKARVKVSVGESEREARKLNEIFLKFISTGQPFVAVKWVQSLDGKIATKTGDSQWISSEESRKVVHHLRNKFDAIMVGAGTVLQDDPELTVRLEKVTTPSHPLRLILDSAGQVPAEAKVVSGKLPGKTLLVVNESLSEDKVTSYQQPGVEVARMPGSSSRLDLKILIKELGKRSITSVLIEGGSQVLTAAFEEQIIDKAYVFIAPKVVGGEAAKGPVEGQGAEFIQDAQQWEFRHVEQIGEDVFVIAYPKL